MFGKLEGGILIPAPKPLQIGGRVHYHPNDEVYLSQGYMRVRETERPAGEGELVPVWQEEGGEIIRAWEELADEGQI